MAIQIEYADEVYKGRTLRITGFKRLAADDHRELLITVNYVDTHDGRRVEKAVLLDGQIIPAILKAFRKRGKRAR